MTEEERDSGIPTPNEATEGYKPLEAELNEEQEDLFPPDINPTVEIGGSPEEREALEKEMTP